MTIIWTVGVTDNEHGGYGVEIVSDEESMASWEAYLGSPVTQAQASFAGVIAALLWIKGQDENDDDVVIYTDSQLVDQVLNQHWALTLSSLRPLYQRAVQLLKDLENRNVLIVQAFDCTSRQEMTIQALQDMRKCPFMLQLLVQQGWVQDSSRKGHEVLIDVVKSVLTTRDIPVIDFPSIKDKAFRRRLHQEGSPESQLLLRSPHLAAISTIEGPVLIACVTSFLRKEEGGIEKVYRVVRQDMLEALRSYQSMGCGVYIVYQAWSNGRFHTFREPEIIHLNLSQYGDVTREMPEWGTIYQIYESMFWMPLSEWADLHRDSEGGDNP